MATPTPCLTGDLRTPGKRRARGALQVRERLAAAPGWVRSPNYSSRGGTAVTGVVIHTAEGPTDANALGAFFAEASSQVSSHAGCDDGKRVNYVDPAYEAWTLRNGNPWTDNLEMCGFASWTRAQWLQHPGMIGQAAEWVAERCHARGIPPRRITAGDIRAGLRSGYFAHWDYTLGTGDGTHWDVGSNFPWDVFDGLVQSAYNGNPEDDMYDATARAEVVGRLDEALTYLKAVTPAVASIQVGVMDPTSGVRTLVLQLAGKPPVQVDPAALAATLVPLLVPALAKAIPGATEQTVETAIRSVLGSLGNAPA